MAFQSDAFQSGAFQQTNPEVPTGSMTYGSRYYGQGPADTAALTVHLLTASVTTVASISEQLLITKLVSATVEAAASIAMGFFRTLETSVVSVGATISGNIVKALNIRRATTKMLTYINTTRSLDGFRKTFGLNLLKTTKDTTED